MAKQPETRFKEMAVKSLKILENEDLIAYEKIQQLAKRGTLDLIICAGGIYVTWELKVGKNTLDPLQRYSRYKIKKARGIVREVRPDNLNEALEELEKIAKIGIKFMIKEGLI